MSNFWKGFEKRAGHWDNYFKLEENGNYPAAKKYLIKNRDSLAEERAREMGKYLKSPIKPLPQKPGFLQKAKTGLGGAAIGAGSGSLFGALAGKKGALIGAGALGALGGLVGYKSPGLEYKGKVHSNKLKSDFQMMGDKEKQKHLNDIGQATVETELGSYREDGGRK